MLEKFKDIRIIEIHSPLMMSETENVNESPDIADDKSLNHSIKRNIIR
jgi:hypothetical protein